MQNMKNTADIHDRTKAQPKLHIINQNSKTLCGVSRGPFP